MAEYVIGDVQGCFGTLERLLEEIEFRAGRDEVILAGDLVNRGPDSVGVARWVLEQGAGVRAVLGNHDVHLLAVMCGAQVPGKRDTLEALLRWEEAEAFRRWLLTQSFVCLQGDFVVVHAGLLPAWSVPETMEFNSELMELLRGPGATEFLRAARRDPPAHFEEATTPFLRAQFLLNVFTRMRICDDQGRLTEDFFGVGEPIPEGYRPWFEHERPALGRPIVCGHWASRGYFEENGVVGLDSGCVWGNGLTALRLDDARVFQVPTVEGEEIPYF